MNIEKVPVTVLTGYLGAGKTTLLNRILSEEHGRKYAVIVNEFGEEGIDNDLIMDADEEVFQMNNGCICCTVRGDLIRIVLALLKRPEPLDGILIETTGLADPAPVVQTFFVDEDLANRVKLDSVVTVVDAKHIAARLADSHEAEEQIAFADTILINKTDLVDAAGLGEVEKRIRAINRFSSLHHTSHADVTLSSILDRGAFDLDRLLEIEPALLEEDDHEHDDTIVSVSLKSEKPLDAKKFGEWIRELIRTRGTEIFRSKGILSLADTDRRYVFQGVHMVMDNSWGAPWNPGESRISRLVLIGRNLDETSLKEAFDSCTA
jgi:G3E family GTPase